MSKKLEELLKQLLRLHPKYIDLSLIRLKSLLEKLDNPEKKLPPVIHIAGTNGKGSTLSYIRYILMEHNLKVHAYVSPHLRLFNERIILSNKEINTYKLNKALEFVKKINAKKPITFFEIITATAFYLFSKEKADYLILETGLGGRLDATNVVKNSLMNIITPIGIDHQEFLGKKITKITDEKLGIIKKNSHIIISKQKPIVKLHILKKLKKNTKSIIFYNKEFKVVNKEEKFFTIRYNNEIITYNKPKLIGDHQIENATTAIASILRLKELGYKFSNQKISNGIIKTKWPGRLEERHLNGIKVYLDGAHNNEGAIQLYKYFKEKKIKTWLIIGMLNNKDIYNFLKILKPILKGVIAISIPGEKNSFATYKIKNTCTELNLISYEKNSFLQAKNFLLRVIEPQTILVTGSLYLIGKIRNKYL
jgi:dihydrofolate synthase/folylpolyglutamate synthase